MGQNWSGARTQLPLCCCSKEELDSKQAWLPHEWKTSDTADTILPVYDKLTAEERHSEAEPLIRAALSHAEQNLGEDHQTTKHCLGCLGSCLLEQQKYELALEYLQQAVRLEERSPKPNTRQLLKQLHKCLCQMGRDSDATEIERRLLYLKATGVTRDWTEDPLTWRRHFLGSFDRNKSVFESQTMYHTISVNAVKMVLIMDVGQDSDDEMGLLLAAELVKAGEMELLAVIANLRPAASRAALARGSLDMLGLQSVPVGIGSDVVSKKHTDTFSQYITVGKTGIDYFTGPRRDVERVQSAFGTSKEDQVAQECRIFDGQKLLKETFLEAGNNTVSLLLSSSLTDAGLFIQENSALFAQKIQQVIIMGGTKPPEPAKDLEPSDAHNNEFDYDASKFLYQKCQEMGVPLVVLSRFAAYGCPLQKKVYDLMVRCPVPNPVACRLQRAQRESIEKLWQNVCEGGILPDRCDVRWFCDTFCEGNGDGLKRSKDDSIWDLVKIFNMYDPLALLAALPSRRAAFFDPVDHVSSRGVRNQLLGVSPGMHGILNKDDLHDFMMTAFLRAAGRAMGDVPFVGNELRPVELDAEQLTAALEPMRKHPPEEMEELKKNVLGILDNEWPKHKNSSKLAGSWKKRDELMRQLAPPMLLLDPDTVNRIGRIPHSAEGKGISLEEASQLAAKEGKRFFIEMFSHRWCSQYAPDDRHNNKARVLVEWAQYRRSMGLRTFFWVDYVCINQSDIAPGVAMLPLYVSCCNNILCYDTPAYEPRAWCRVERLMFVAFVAPNIEYVDPKFCYENGKEREANGELKPAVQVKDLVPDPSAPDSQLSFPSDIPLISELKNLCTQHWSKCWKSGLMEICETKGSLNHIRNLMYGGTQVRCRKFA